MNNVTDIRRYKPVEGLRPTLYPAVLIARPTHLQCGRCGFSGMVEFYVGTDEEWCFDPVCNCPIEAVLYA